MIFLCYNKCTGLAEVSEDSFAMPPCKLERAGMRADNFFRANGHRIRDMATVIAPYLAAEAPTLATGVATAGQVASAYSALRDKFNRAAA